MRKFLLFFALITAGFGQTVPAGIEKVTSVEGITEYKLQNGLRLLVFPDPAKSTITVNMTYLVGSRHEGAGEAGMAHLLEHMLFKGSTKHTNVPAELTEHGARPNGTTNYDRTNYFETFQATDTNLKWALDLESDRMVNSFVKKSDLDSEFTVVRNEFESGENNPFQALFKSTMSAAYLWHSYGRSVIGNKSDIEKVPIDRLKAFYAKFYQPDNAVLTVAGKIDEGQILATVKQYFGAIPKPARVLAPTYTREPVQDGERMTVVRRVGDIQAVIAAYHIPDGGHPDMPALDVLASVLSEQPAGRLYKSLVDNKKAVQVFANSMGMNEPGLFVTGAIVNKGDSIDAARTTLIDTIKGVVTEPPSKEEVDRARNRIMKEVEIGLRNSEGLGLTLSEYLGTGDWRLVFLNRDQLKKVTPEDVQRVAKMYFKDSNRTVGEFIPDAKPDRVEIGAKTDLTSLLKDYKGDAAMAQGEAFDPTPANIEGRVKRSVLSGGLKVTLFEKKTRGNAVHANISVEFGDLEKLKNLEMVGSIAGSLLTRGTSKMDRQNIQDAFDKIKSQIRIGGGPTSANISIETTREYLVAAIKLAAQIIRDPIFPETEFEQVKKTSITGLENAKNEPQAVASIALNSALVKYPTGDLRHVLTIDEQLAAIKTVTLPQVKSFYKTFYGASHGDAAVVGDFDSAEVSNALSESFGNWKSPSGYERVKNPLQNNAPVNLKLETPDKANAVFLAALPIEMSDDDGDYPAMVLGNYMLGGGFLNSRLAVRIRQKEGLSYGVGSSFGASHYEKSARLSANAISNPENVAKLEAAFLDELVKAAKDGFTAAEIEAAKSGWIQSRQVNRSDDGALAGTLGNRSFNERTMMWDAKFEAAVMALTPATLNAAFARNVDPKKIFIVKAGDFAKAAKAAK